MVGIELPYKLSNSEIKGIIKKHSGYWNSEDKLWTIHLKDYEKVFNEVEAYYKEGDNQVKVSRIAKFAFECHNEINEELIVRNIKYTVPKSIHYSKLETNIDPTSLSFYDRLYPFQKESLVFGINKHGRLLLADEMGVGKTIQSLAIATIYKHEWPLLIICPSALRLNWQQEVLNWMEEFIKKSEVQVYNKGGTAIRETTKILIVSYDLAWKMLKQLQHFQVVIADEAHYLKNWNNKRSDLLRPYLSTRRRIILLTGTPAFARPREIFNLISIIRPDLYYKFREFGYRYCEPSQNMWSRAMEYNGCANTKELHYLLKDKIMIRRLKKDVLTDLPDKLRQKISIETNKTIVQEIKQIMNNNGNSFEKLLAEMINSNNHAYEHGETPASKETLANAFQLSGKAKIEGVKEYLKSLLENEAKVLIFAHHHFMLDSLEAAMVADKHKYIRIDGSVSKEARHERVQMFQNNESILVALLSITAAGVGLTLTAASTVVFAELHWTPGMMVQAEDRAHRIGQRSCVNCHYLIGENTLDATIYNNLEKKVKQVSAFVEGKKEELEIEKMDKGYLGKISRNVHPINQVVMSKPNTMFKFLSAQQCLAKDNQTKDRLLSQNTDISDDISESTLSRHSLSRKRCPQFQVEHEEIIESSYSSKKPCHQPNPIFLLHTQDPPLNSNTQELDHSECLPSDSDSNS